MAKPSKADATATAPKPTATQEPIHYEFGGPIGAFGITAGLPLLCYVFAFACNDVSGCPAPSLLSPSTLDLETLKAEVGWPGFGGLGSWKAMGATVGYYLSSAVLYRVLPGQIVQGTVLECGGRLGYKFNALSSSLITLALAFAASLAHPAGPANFPLWPFISNNYLQILTANIIIAFFISIFVYIRSFSVPNPSSPNPQFREIVHNSNTGNIIYDHYLGREKNPRVTLPLLGEIDLKEWCEVRPGLLGWVVLNLSFVAKQYREFGFVTDSILFVTAVQMVYVIDCWVMEPAILTTMDITTDGFGFMLSFGDLVWVPFIYSLQTKYLATYPTSLGPYGLAGVCALLATGYWIFRSSNSQKNAFRTNPDDPKVKCLKYIETKSGSKLLISGWWGVARHVNYLGDWIQSWPYCLPTGVAGYSILSAAQAAGDEGGEVVEAGFEMLDGRRIVQGDARGWGMLVTYFYVVYFAVLLIHRDGRDDEKCAKKYGDDWERYKKIVRWKIVPGIY